VKSPLFPNASRLFPGICALECLTVPVNHRTPESENPTTKKARAQEYTGFKAFVKLFKNSKSRCQSNSTGYRPTRPLSLLLSRIQDFRFFHFPVFFPVNVEPTMCNATPQIMRPGPYSTNTVIKRFLKRRLAVSWKVSWMGGEA